MVTKSNNGHHPDQDMELAPHSIQAEKAVLGSVLLNPECLIEILFLTPEDFYLVRHGWIWSAFVALRKRGDQVDHLIVIEELETRGQLAEVGGAAYVISLINETPSALNVVTYAGIVQSAALRRRLIDAAQLVARAAHSDETEIDQVVATAQQAINDVTRGYGKRQSTPLRVLVSDHYDNTFQAMKDNTPPTNLSTGLVDLDKLSGGLRKGDLIIPAARPGMGKTSLMLGIAAHVSSQGHPVGFLSFEMSSRALTTRLLAMESGIPFQDLDDKRIPADKMDAYVAAVGKVSELPIMLNDDPSNRSIAKAVNTARQLYLDQGIELLFVDYMQMMSAPGQENRNQEISLISREWKGLAMELQIPVMVACQFSRATEARADKRPMLSDLRDSGTIEQDMDLGFFIYRDRYYNHDTSEGDKAEINIPKNRNGRTGSVDVIFLGERMSFKDAVTHHVDFDWELQDLKKNQYKTTTPALYVAGRDDPGDKHTEAK